MAPRNRQQKNNDRKVGNKGWNDPRNNHAANANQDPAGRANPNPANPNAHPDQGGAAPNAAQNAPAMPVVYRSGLTSIDASEVNGFNARLDDIRATGAARPQDVLGYTGPIHLRNGVMVHHADLGDAKRVFYYFEGRPATLVIFAIDDYHQGDYTQQVQNAYNRND